MPYQSVFRMSDSKRDRQNELLTNQQENFINNTLISIWIPFGAKDLELPLGLLEFNISLLEIFIYNNFTTFADLC